MKTNILYIAILLASFKANCQTYKAITTQQQVDTLNSLPILLQLDITSPDSVPTNQRITNIDRILQLIGMSDVINIYSTDIVTIDFQHKKSVYYILNILNNQKLKWIKGSSKLNTWKYKVEDNKILEEIDLQIDSCSNCSYFSISNNPQLKDIDLYMGARNTKQSSDGFTGLSLNYNTQLKSINLKSNYNGTFNSVYIHHNDSLKIVHLDKILKTNKKIVQNDYVDGITNTTCLLKCYNNKSLHSFIVDDPDSTYITTLDIHGNSNLDKLCFMKKVIKNAPLTMEQLKLRNYIYENKTGANSIEEVVSSNCDTVSSTNNIEKNSKNLLFKIYPNPTKALLNITKFQEGIYQLKMSNAQGEIVLVKKIVESISIPIDHLAKGYYFIEMYSEKGHFTEKLIIE